MIDGLKPYPAYKDSGAPWLGRVPDHWEVTRARNLLREMDVRSKTGAETHLSMSQRLGLVPSSEMEERRLVSESYAGAKLCQVGDLVLNRLKAHLGVFARASRPGLVSPDYTVLRPVSDSVAIPFLEYVLRSSPCRTELRTRAKGLVEGFWRLYTDDLYQIKLPAPPISEQNAIIRFLDHASRQIQRYIRVKTKLIALLNEQKQALIHRLVTRGLDSRVRLKPSRVEWLRDVPQHWAVTRLKFEASDIVDCLHATPLYVEAGGYPAIRTADVEAGKVRLAKARRVNNDEYVRWTSRLEPKPGDILYSREGERYGIAALVPPGVALCISQRMMVFRIATRHCSAFIMWQLNSRQVYDQAAADQIGATAPHINVDRIKNYWVTMPPIDEQFAIARHIEDRCRSLETSIERIEQELALIREYRFRLISDVVTGELDVREAAGRLPNVAEPLDVADAVTEGEEDDLDAVPEEAEA